MHKIMFSNKDIIRCVVLLSTLILSSSSPLLRSSSSSSSISSKVNIAESTSTRILQSDSQPPNSSTINNNNGSSDSGSTLVIVGAVGAVLSILLLIGGMCYAKRKYSDSSTSRDGEYELNNMISSMEKNAAKKDGKGNIGGGFFKRGSSKGASSGTSPSKHSNHNNNGRDAAIDIDAGYESDIPPPPQELFGGRNPRDMLLEFYQTHNPTKVNEVDKVLAKYAGKEELMFRTLAEKYNVDPSIFGLANKQVPPSNNAPQDDNSYDDQTSSDEEGGQHHTTTADDDMSFAYSVDQSSIFGFNKSNNTANPSIDPYIGGAAMQSFQNEKGGVFEWNEDGTKMVYTPAMGDADKKAQNGFVYDERKKKWVVSKQAVGSKGVSFKATTSANDGKSSAIMMAPESPKRTSSDASSAISGRSDGTGMTGLTGMGSEFTFGAVGNDYSTVRTRSGTTFVSTGIAIPSVGADDTEGVEVEGVSAPDIDRIMLADSLSDDYSDGGGNSESGHVAGTYDDDDEPGMIIPKRTVRYPTSNTIEEDVPYDDEPGMIKPRRSKPVPNFENRTRQLPKRNRKPSFGRRV